MATRVLVVDDNPRNLALLEAKLAAEYFEVIPACNGEQALDRVASDLPDIVFLDVMMPGMDGFEVCRRIKANPKTASIPVAMIINPDQRGDGVIALNAGADDLLIKPIDDITLFARIRNLVRLKQMTEELRMREEAGHNMGPSDATDDRIDPDPSGRIMIVEDRPESLAWFRAALEPKNKVFEVSAFDEAMVRARTGDFDLIIVSLGIRAFDGLRLSSHLRSMTETRNTPILVVVNDGDTRKLKHAIEMGVNDYLMRPIDKYEMLARVRTQLRKKRYADKLRHGIQLRREMAVTDQLTGLHNRGYMSRHLYTLMKNASPAKPVALLAIEIDCIKAIKEAHGREASEQVLRELASRLAANVRGIDLACRYEDEQFVVVMPDTDTALALSVAERLRKSIEAIPFLIGGLPKAVNVAVSIGSALSSGGQDTPKLLLARVFQAPYLAQREGGYGAAPFPGARMAPDGQWYVSDPTRPGKYLRVGPVV